MERFIESVVVEDDLIKTIKFQRGREVRPLEAALAALRPQDRIKWIDRLAPFEAIACEWALAQAYEAALKIKVSLRAEHIRALLAELQRLNWGFHYLSQVFRALEDATRLQQALRLREYTSQGLEIFTGARVLPQALCLGGVERDFSVGEIRKFKELLRNIEFEMRLFFRDLTEESAFTQRVSGVLPIDARVLKSLSWFGVMGHASGIGGDLRQQQKYGIYDQLSIKWFNAGTEGNSQNDALARMQSVLFQIRQSINICYHLLVGFPEGELSSGYLEDIDEDRIESTAVVEGASGPVTAIILKNTVRVETVSMRIAPYLETLLEGVHFEDMKLAISSVGFSFEEADQR